MRIPQGEVVSIEDYGHELVIMFTSGDVLVVYLAEDGDWLTWKLQ